MALNTLATTTFATGPDDKTIVADIYTVSEPGVINSIDDNSNSLDKILARDSKVTDLTGGDLAAVFNKKLADKALTDASISGRISNAVSGLVSNYRGLSDTLKKSLTISPLLGRVITATLGSKVTNVLSKNLSSAKTVSGMIDSFTKDGNSINFTDKGALTGLVSGLASEGSRLGLPNTFTRLAASVNNKGIMMAAATSLLPKAAKSGNIDLLRDIANSPLKNDIVKIMPNIIPKTVSNYSLSSLVQKKDYASQYDYVKGTFTDINPGWNTIKRNGVSTLSGISVSGSKGLGDLLTSKVMKQIHPITTSNFTTTNPHVEDEKFLLAAKDSATDVNSCLKKDFPTVPVTTDIVSTSYIVSSPEYA